MVDIEFCVPLDAFCSFAYTCLITSALANRHMLKALFTCEIHIIIILIVISKITFNNNY